MKERDEPVRYGQGDVVTTTVWLKSVTQEQRGSSRIFERIVIDPDGSIRPSFDNGYRYVSGSKQ